MSGEKKNIKPKLNEGEYVFCSVENIEEIEKKILSEVLRKRKVIQLYYLKRKRVILG